MIGAESSQALAVIGPSIDFNRQECIRDRHVHPIAAIRQGLVLSLHPITKNRFEGMGQQVLPG